MTNDNVNQPQEAVAVLIADPMFLPALNVPLMDWKVDVTNLPIGTELYTSQPADKAEIARLNETINYLRGHLQNCINHLEGMQRRYPNNDLNEPIAHANNALYKSL